MTHIIFTTAVQAVRFLLARYELDINATFDDVPIFLAALSEGHVELTRVLVEEYRADLSDTVNTLNLAMSTKSGLTLLTYLVEFCGVDPSSFCRVMHDAGESADGPHPSRQLQYLHQHAGLTQRYWSHQDVILTAPARDVMTTFLLSISRIVPVRLPPELWLIIFSFLRGDECFRFRQLLWPCYHLL